MPGRPPSTTATKATPVDWGTSRGPSTCRSGRRTAPGTQRLREGASLRDQLHSANVSRGRRMVAYDGSGVAAAKLAFVLSLLGHEDVAVYDGGWAEWGNRLDLPVDR